MLVKSVKVEPADSGAVIDFYANEDALGAPLQHLVISDKRDVVTLALALLHAVKISQYLLQAVHTDSRLKVSND